MNLAGKLLLTSFPGPPEYSSIKDGDRLNTCWLLELDEASFKLALMTPVPEPANFVRDILKRENPNVIMLGLDDDIQKYCSSYKDKEVTVSGYLYHAHTAHHYTPLLMDVTDFHGTKKLYGSREKCSEYSHRPSTALGLSPQDFSALSTAK